MPDAAYTTLPGFAFTSVADAAGQLRAVARARRTEALHVFPYSHYDSTNTTWWLAPPGLNASDPAYRYGKIVLQPDIVVASDELFVGLHVEKGVGDEAAEPFATYPRGLRLTMGRDWLWHPFSRALRSGDVTEAANAAEASAGRPLTVAMVASVAQLPTERDERPRPADPDVVRWNLSASRATLIDKATPGSLLDAFGSDETLQTIGDKLRVIPKLDWLWVEVFLGLRFAKDGSDTWTAERVWDRSCSPWLGWVR